MPDILLHPCVDRESTAPLKKCEIITRFYHRPGISNKRNSTFCHHPPFRSSCFPLYFWQTPWNSINFAIIFSRISINISREREREDNGYFLEKTHWILNKHCCHSNVILFTSHLRFKIDILLLLYLNMILSLYIAGMAMKTNKLLVS